MVAIHLCVTLSMIPIKVGGHHDGHSHLPTNSSKQLAEKARNYNSLNEQSCDQIRALIVGVDEIINDLIRDGKKPDDPQIKKWRDSQDLWKRSLTLAEASKVRVIGESSRSSR